jgi:hypothetical protein
MAHKSLYLSPAPKTPSDELNLAPFGRSTVSINHRFICVVPAAAALFTVAAFDTAPAFVIQIHSLSLHDSESSYYHRLLVVVVEHLPAHSAREIEQ